jgi:hypothetical protein
MGYRQLLFIGVCALPHPCIVPGPDTAKGLAPDDPMAQR